MLEFCRPDVWEPLIRNTQAGLFDPDFLVACGQHFRAAYHDGGPDDWLVIPPSACRFSQGAAMVSTCSGYDLPICFTPADWSGRFVLLLAQDPKRNPHWETGARELSMTTPWSFHVPAHASTGHGAKLWPCIAAICAAGHGVFIADAEKLYVHPKDPPKTAETCALEAAVLRLEIALLQPLAIVTFGHRAAAAATQVVQDQPSPGAVLDHHPHPAARSPILRRHYGIADTRHATLAQAITRQVSAAVQMR